MRRFALVLVLALWAGECFAHGVGYRQSELRAIPLEFFYSTGEKMSYREARVFSPKDEKFAVQSGRTDEEGRFAFVPDCSGDWRVIVRDEEGHQCTADLTITQDFLDGRTQSQTQDSSLPQGTDLIIRALLGVSVIFNLALIIRWRSKHAH